MSAEKALFSYRPYWAKRFGVAPVLPTSREEMDDLGWDACDVILVTGDAYVDHPSFGMAVIGRVLEAQGFRVGIIAQPDWQSSADFMRLGKPSICFGVTAGNMDSMVNRYTSDKKRRSNDAYTPGGEGGRRPDRSVIVYAQRCREACKEVPIILGGIEASLRRLAHYDYWSDKVRRSVLVDAKADLLVYGNGERQIIEIVHRLANKEPIDQIDDIRGTVVLRNNAPQGWQELSAQSLGRIESKPAHQDSDAICQDKLIAAGSFSQGSQTLVPIVSPSSGVAEENKETITERTVIRLPAFEEIKGNPNLYAHASRAYHGEMNPGNARAIVQRHGEKELWVNPPAIPLTTAELDKVFELPYTRVPHPVYGQENIPAYEMIRYSVNIMRGCFGGCTFCSITEHEGRIIQSRSEQSILNEIEAIRDTVPGFTGVISDVGGPTANMYRMACKDKKIEASCRRPSCVFPKICSNLNTDHSPLIKLYRKARKLDGIKKILVASGLRYDLAIRSPEYIEELATHHVGGYLKIAPEHTEAAPLSKMMKPEISSYYTFKKLFDEASKKAGKEQYLIPYFIAAHPGSSDEDMLNLALWLKKNEFRLDQVQTFLPSPMAVASAMYHSNKNPLRKVTNESESVWTAKSATRRRLHKAFLRYHDANNWPALRAALRKMGRADLIGNGKRHLIPSWQPAGTGEGREGSNKKVEAVRMPEKRKNNATGKKFSSGKKKAMPVGRSKSKQRQR